MTSTSGAGQFILDTIQNNKNTITNRYPLKKVNVLFPSYDDLEKNSFPFGTQVNYISANQTSISNGSVLRFTLTNSYLAVDNLWLELIIPGSGSPVFPTSNFFTAYSFINNVKCTVGSNVIFDKIDGQSLLMYNQFVNNGGDIQTAYAFNQLANLSGTLTSNQRVLIPLPILANQASYFPGFGKWSLAYHAKGYQLWPMSSDSIVIEITINQPSYVITSGSFTNNSFVSANLRFISYVFNNKFLPKLPYLVMSPNQVFSYQQVSLTTTLSSFSISSIIKPGELQALLIAFTSTSNYSALDYNNFTKALINRIQIQVRNLILIDYDGTRSANMNDDVLNELEGLGKNLELLSYRTTGNNNTGPFYFFPMNPYSQTISQLGCNGANIQSESVLNVNIQTTSSVTYNMKVVGIYKALNYTDENGKSNYDM